MGYFMHMGGEEIWVGWGGNMGGTRCMGGLTKSVVCKLSYDLNFATQPSLVVRDAEGPYAKLYLIF